MSKRSIAKYVAAFLITVAIFATAFLVSNYINQQRVENIRAMQEEISTNILSVETQFDLLQESSCQYISENSVLTEELNSLARRLSYAESQLGTDDEQVKRLKRQYSLLQIKDYLLMKEISSKCDINPVFVLYFYSNKGDCDTCEKMGHVLTYLRQEYPKLRVYSFDYNLDLAALQTLISINDIAHELPAIVVQGEAHYGFKSRERMEALLPRLNELRATTTAATSTQSATTTNK